MTGPTPPAQSSPMRVAVLDAGGQYVDMVQKAVQRQGIQADVLSLQTPIAEIQSKYAAIIISGSPASSHAEAAPQPDKDLWKTELPILGICYGMQSMAMAHGGQVTKNAIREDGRVITTVNTTHPVFSGSKKDFTGLFTHGDFVTKLPDGFDAIGQHTLSDGTVAYSAIARGNKIGVQFHPEVFDDTPEGYQIFKNFLHGVAGLDADVSYQDARLRTLAATLRCEIYDQVGDRQVIAFVSGGVDSSVAATLAATEIKPDKFHAYYIDSGFMRDEDDRVIEMLNAAGMHVTKIDAAEQFERATITIDGIESEKLCETVDPETKRKIIGKTFITIQNDILKSLNLSEALLLQGTNAADRIESGHSKGDSHTETIKTHHNQVQEVQELKARGLLIEPIDELFKDEVRALGRELGLPNDLVERQPFPGPGTAIRIICAAEDQRQLRPIPETAAVKKFVPVGIDVEILPVRSVGVGGDERSHILVAAIANPDLTPEQLSKLGADIPAHFRGVINRVVYALGNRPLNGCKITKTLLSVDARAQLRLADRIVFEEMREFKVLGKIKQMPVILLPLSFGEDDERSIVLRPVTTSTFMTVQAMLPQRDLPKAFFNRVTERIFAEVPGISQVFLDLTNKPPGTTEWE
jgi:GMP synthase (glutamine-hydrolysing)